MAKNIPEEVKSYPAVVKELDHANRTATGFAAIFGNIDSGNDITHRGAFKKTLQENLKRIKFLWQHDWFEPPIAAIVQAEEVGKSDLPKDLREAHPEVTGGLMVTRKYFTTGRGEEVWQALSSTPPAITEMSFAFDPIKVDYEDHEKFGKIRHLRELRAYDFSDVNWGMNALTRASKSRKAGLNDTLAGLMRFMQKLKSDPTLYDDETIKSHIEELTALVGAEKVKPQNEDFVLTFLNQKMRLETEYLELLGE